MKVIIIGGGVVGCAVARELSAFRADVTVIERGSDVASGSSKANSGIVHAGFDAHPGSVKARFNVAGAALLPRLSRELDFPYRNNGALVLGFTDESKEKLAGLYEQGQANGVAGLSIIDGDEARKMEPAVSKDVRFALYAATSGIVGPYEMTIALAENAARNGVKFAFDEAVTGIARAAGGGFCVTTSAGRYECDCVVNCAGVHSDEIAAFVPGGRSERIIPRKGEYMLLDKNCGGLVNATLFQLPTAMGKGVLVSPTVHGNIIVGPTADDIDDKDDVDTTPDGLDRAFSQAALSVPSLNKRNIITQFAGLRAHSTGGDFVVGESDAPGFFNALGVESPGLTSAPAIGKELAASIAARFSLSRNADFDPVRHGIKHFFAMTDAQRRTAIAENPLYGRVVCRCETVTEGEIVEAIHRVPGARDLDGIKRRTRAGMGRCQSGFCTPRLMEILARELGVSMAEVTKHGKGSELVLGKVGEVKAKEESK